MENKNTTPSGPFPPTGLHILIVGAGFAGLSAAIECERKGHRVTLFEKVSSIDEITRYGDIISFDPNGSRAFEKWVFPSGESVAEKMEAIARQTTWLDLFHYKGEFVTRQSFKEEKDMGWEGRRINGHRGELHRLIWEYVRTRKGVEGRGIKVRWGVRVRDYFECDGTESGGKGQGEEGEERERPHAGVIITGADGEIEKVTGDAVLAAEGVRSRGRKLVLGLEEDEQPKSSGYAVYRAWFPSAPVIAKNPITKHLVENGDQHQGFIGPDIHFLVSSIKKGSEINWVFTHIDDGNIEESWQFPGKPEEALTYLEGWCPVVRELVKATPPGRLIDYKLVYREPLPTFVSPKGRIALIGDAAHPFLPTSIQGASQSIEDGSVVAASLELACHANKRGEMAKQKVVPTALKAFEKLRYERVHKAQANGPKMRERWHKADWDGPEGVWNCPERIWLLREGWLLGFDAERDVYRRWAEVVAEIQKKEKGENVVKLDGKSGKAKL
ncbi:hypothetical protein SMACR_06864 [Sordaria macrospora]|uniref:WGS project CABT00000000 data, contig 2.38 n=2 Tax=Sordaria macrospora TaxID=5147 RepID=F7W776_SORMK|nr:uncharacterized protein SMAC_06864 [Sordaria macrospora k-hell]KAA8633669.1 hypothetical protein SMACR_06864 [Sordaria macrospora]KAH7634034.1 hypothetical protein B0T09DRAFT_396417 [Sordaria sp. MPI-SDFR-AT-0083]WPJ59612.1 hypothetical protein SMAC4_06864 [Sordaria macrospora]CCC13367.1 unnamed protein product [Sordaria macrospora k-hell]